MQAAAAWPPSWRTTWPWWLATVLYFAGISLGHLEVSFWLVSEREGPFGRYAFKDFVPAGVVIGVLALLAWVVLCALRSTRPGPLLAHWGLWLLCVAMADRFLTFSLNEVAHYPQYALLAMLLARALDPDRTRRPIGRILFWATLLGLIDEAQQYLWLAPSYGEYLDVNDVVVNLLGAQLGMLLVYGPGSATPAHGQAHRRPWPEWIVTAALCVAVVTGFATDRLVANPPRDYPPGGLHRADDGVLRLYLQRLPDRHGSWRPGAYRERYFVLSPVGGLVLLAVLGVVFTRLPAGAARRPTPTAMPSG